MSKRKRFPLFVYYGFSPDGQVRTLGFPTRSGAWGSLMFTFAAEVQKRSHIQRPSDDEKAKLLGWSTGRRRAVKP